MPERIQRKRSKGWRMPENTLYVGRPTKWGNQFPIGLLGREASVMMFEESLNDWKNNTFGYGDSHSFEEYIAPLRGKNLACWCPLDKVCHADVLLRLANAVCAPTNGDSPASAPLPRENKIQCQLILSTGRCENRATDPLIVETESGERKIISVCESCAAP